MYRTGKIILLIAGLFWAQVGHPASAQSFEDVIAPSPAAQSAKNIKYNPIVNSVEAEKLKMQQSVILIYYQNFKIDTTPSGRVSCDLRLAIYSTIPNKITSLSFKLIWPEIDTATSFYDVEPNVATYFDITLLGEGCYTMDKVPNIVLNRCRIKDMTSEECAAKLTWATIK